MKKIKLKDLLLFLVCAITIIFSNMVASNMFGLNQKIINKNIIIVFFCIFVEVINNFKCEERQKNYGFKFLWISFLISVIISKIINKDTDILNIFYLIIVTPMFFNKKSYNVNRYIPIACSFALLPLIFFIKSNNTTGLILTIIDIVVLNYLIDKLSKKNNYIILIMTIVIFGSLILITRSRTGLLTFIIINIINYFYIIANGKLTLKKLIKGLTGIIIMCIFISLISNMIYGRIFNKYIASNTDLSSGRTKIWKSILSQNLTMFGNGEKYILETTGIKDAHNNYIQIIGHYGLVPLYIYILLTVSIFIRLLKKKNNIKLINFFFAYFLIGMFENVLITDTRFITFNILFYIYIGELLYNNQKEKLDCFLDTKK